MEEEDSLTSVCPYSLPSRCLFCLLGYVCCERRARWLDGPLSQLVLPSSRCVVEVIPPKEEAEEEEEEEEFAFSARFHQIQRCPACRRHSARCRSAPTAGNSFCRLCRLG
jgi:hypothetical protein